MRHRLTAGRRAPGLRTAKTTLAAVLAFVVAERLGTSPDPVLAPLTALLVVQLTLHQTVAHGWERVASVTSGVLVAVAVAAAVAAGLVAWRRTGALPPPQDLWAAATDPVTPAR